MTSVNGESRRDGYKYTVTYPSRTATGTFRFSTTELKHLTVGALLVMGVGLSFTLYGSFLELANLVGLAIIFTLSFLLHELAHKISAQYFGLWAEFRLTMQGALVTLISMLLPFFKIISPGAMMIAGPVSREKAGKTALSGPITNILFSAVCIILTLLIDINLIIIVAWGAWINALIAFFNLLPFGVMDGLKILWWNKMVWTLVFVASILLMIYTYGFTFSSF